MSAYPDDPSTLRTLARGSPTRAGVLHGGFVTRGVYGDYLQDLLRQALEDTAAGAACCWSRTRPSDVQRAGQGWKVGLALGREIEAQAVVMALGVLRPALLRPWPARSCWARPR